MRLSEVPNGEMFTSSRMTGTFWRSNDCAFRIGGKAVVYTEDDVADCTIYVPPPYYAEGKLTPPSEFQAIVFRDGYAAVRELLRIREEFLKTLDVPEHRLLCAFEIEELKEILRFEDH